MPNHFDLQCHSWTLYRHQAHNVIKSLSNHLKPSTILFSDIHDTSRRHHYGSQPHLSCYNCKHKLASMAPQEIKGITGQKGIGSTSTHPLRSSARSHGDEVPDPSDKMQSTPKYVTLAPSPLQFGSSVKLRDTKKDASGQTRSEGGKGAVVDHREEYWNESYPNFSDYPNPISDHSKARNKQKHAILLRDYAADILQVYGRKKLRENMWLYSITSFRPHTIKIWVRSYLSQLCDLLIQRGVHVKAGRTIRKSNDLIVVLYITENVAPNSRLSTKIQLSNRSVKICTISTTEVPQPIYYKRL